MSIQKCFPSLGVFYKEYRPDFRLSSYVSYYWMLRFEDIEYPVPTTPPDGGSDIIIDMDDPYNPLFFGQSAAFFKVPKGRRQNIFGVRLKPGASHTLFLVSAFELFDEVLPLSLLVSKSKFEEYKLALEKHSITQESSFELMSNIIERWIFTAGFSTQNLDFRINKLLYFMNNIAPDTSVDSIVNKMALSPRQLERVFKQLYGLTPKSLLRINRFQAVLVEKNRMEHLTWIDISQLFGYYDQSHLCRDFKQFTGMAPQEYLSPEKIISK